MDEEKKDLENEVVGVEETASDNTTKLGIPVDIEAGLCYVLGWLSGIVFFLIERDNKYIQFHAAQSAVVFLGLLILQIVLGFIPIIGIITILITPFTLVLWIFLMYKAFTGVKYRVPFVADFVDKNLLKMEL